MVRSDAVCIHATISKQRLSHGLVHIPMLKGTMGFQNEGILHSITSFCNEMLKNFIVPLH